MENSQKTKEQNVLFIKFIKLLLQDHILSWTRLRSFPQWLIKDTVSRFPNRRYSASISVNNKMIKLSLNRNYWRNSPIDIWGPTEVNCEIYEILFMKAFLLKILWKSVSAIGHKSVKDGRLENHTKCLIRYNFKL